MKKNPIGAYVKVASLDSDRSGPAFYQIKESIKNSKQKDGFSMFKLNRKNPFWSNNIWLPRFMVFKLVKKKKLEDKGYSLEVLSKDEYLMETVL
jgi:hypothetical protein